MTLLYPAGRRHVTGAGEIDGISRNVETAEVGYVEPRTDGPVLANTREALLSGANGQKAISEQALAKVVGEATRVTGRVIAAYTTHVARGELGATGTGTASNAPPLSEGCATGLLYGKVQSGKTLAMIATAALALDNGFRVIIVLTSDNVSLVEQTASRFSALQGATVRSSDNIGSWVEDERHFASALQGGGLVLVSAKNTAHLRRFCDFLAGIGAARYPALILDDEADQASLDTNTRKRSQADDPATVAASKIYDWTNGEDSIRTRLPHHVYLQVTATPFALLLQNIDNSLRPSFTELIEPGEGYVGGDFFFHQRCFRDDGGANPPLCFAPESDIDELVTHEKLPESLELALAFFLSAAAAEGLTSSRYRFAAQNFLVHTSVRKVDHKAAADMIRKRLSELYDSLLRGHDSLAADTFFTAGLQELRKTVEAPPSLGTVKEYVKSRLQDREVLVVNSEKDKPRFGSRLNFIVGGNILGRGLTIENLLATYYLRSANIGQMDTVLQHARMFGYRQADKPYLRVFLPQLEANRFRSIQVAEENLRDLLEEAKSSTVPIQVISGLRPTRPGVLDANSIETIRPGEVVFPPMPFIRFGRHGVDTAGSTSAHDTAFRKLVDVFFAGDFSVFAKSKPKAERLRTTTISAVIDALSWIPYPPEPERRGNWDPRILRLILESCSEKFENQALVYGRDAERTNITVGMLGGTDISKFKSKGVPVLCLFYDRSETSDRRGVLRDVSFPYVFPQLIFPSTARGKVLPTQVINVTGLEEN